MSIALINTGTADNDGTGDHLKAAGIKLNASLAYLDTKPDNLKIGARGLTGKMTKKLLSDTAWFGWDASTTGFTIMSRIALASHFDAVRILIPNLDTNPVSGVRVAVGIPDRPGAWQSGAPSVDGSGAAVALPYGPGPWTDPAANQIINPGPSAAGHAGAYRMAQFGGLNLLGAPTSVTLPAALDDSDAVPSWTASNWMSVGSVPRGDGGTLPLIDVRIEYPASTTAYLTVTDAKKYARWGRDDRPGGDGGTFNGGRLWRSWAHAGLGVSAGINFQDSNTPITVPYAVPFIVQYRAKGRVISFLYGNDSIGEFNDDGIFGNSYAVRAVLAWAAANPSTPIELCPIVWPSGAYREYGVTCESLLELLEPTLTAIKPLGPNDISNAPLTDSSTRSYARFALQQRGQSILLGQRHNGRIIIEPTIAAGYSNWGATDSVRRAWNDAFASEASAMAYTFADIEPSLTTTSSTGTGGQVLLDATASADGVHLINAGHAAAMTPFFAAMTTALDGLA